MAGAALGTAFRQLRGIFGAVSVVGLGDGPLLDRYSGSKDEAAFEALVNRHGPMVLATCRAVLRNEHDVEDAFQATFLVLARKAGSIRAVDALGGWLHRVAYRVSVEANIQARRRSRKEAEASAMAPPESSTSILDDDLRSALHEEIERLPEGQRLPVVLCDLEGLTYEQAAEQLRWPLPTLRGRLARARQRLKARLIRRGATALAVGALTMPTGASAAVPPALLKAARLAATGGKAPAGVALLTHTILKGMLMTKIKIASMAALAALALASVGVIAAGGRGLAEPRPDGPPKGQASTRPEAKAAPSPVDLIDVRGIVVAPDGKPVAGALVYAVRPAPVPETTSGPDGRFHLRVPHPEPALRKLIKKYPQVIASAPGLGLNQAAPLYPADPAFDLKVQLVEAGPAIEGRIIDLDGRPIAGALVNPNVIYFAETGRLDPWIARVKAKQVKGFDGLWGIVTMKGEVCTDHEGRFRLTGLGLERVAELIVSGPTIANSTVNVVLRDGPEFQGQGADHFSMSPKSVVYHTPKFDAALPPTKPIEGVVRDKDTDRPIEGLPISASVFDEHSHVAPGIYARTDAQGRYRIAGLVKAPAYRVSVHNPTEHRGLYLDESRKVTAVSPGLEPVVADLSLKPGVVVRGRVVDQTTGRPVEGSVVAFSFADNPNLGAYPGYSEGRAASSRTDEDGRYQLVTIPGRGVIGFQAEWTTRSSYRDRLGVEAIAGYDAGFGGFLNAVPSPSGQMSFNSLAEINPKPGEELASADLQVESARSLELALLDPEGRPIQASRAQGTSTQNIYFAEPVPATTTIINVMGLDGTTPRRVTVLQDGRKLVGSTYLKGDESGRLTLRLQPWGSVVGQILINKEKPRRPKALSVGNNTPGTKPEEAGIIPQDISGTIEVDKDGRFRLDGLMPDLKYAASTTDGEVILGDIFKDVTVAPGEVKDLGELKVRPYQP